MKLKKLFKRYDNRKKQVPKFAIYCDSEIIGIQADIDLELKKQYESERNKK